MRSKPNIWASTIGVLVATAATFACGSSSTLPSNDYEVGRRPEFYSASYLWRAGDANAVVAIDREGHTVQQFSLDPFEHVRSLPLPLDYDEQGVVASHDGAYYITIAGNEFAILKADGSVNANPVDLLGSVRSIAFDPVHHLAVLSDEYQSMALLVLSPDGEVLGTWKAGSLFGDNKYVVAGTMLADGRLILSLNETTIAVVDVAESVANQEWSKTTFEVPGAKQMSWLASVPDLDNIVMVMDATRILTLNIDTQKIIDHKDLEGSETLGKFRDYVPHVLTRATSSTTGDVNTVTFVDKKGTLKDTSIKGTSNSQITQTLFDRDQGMLSIVYDPEVDWSWSWDDDRYYSKQSIFRFRLADSLAMDRTDIEDDVRLVTTPNFTFLLYPSALGKAERRNYGKNSDTQLLEGYNFDMIRQRYSADD